MKNLRRVICLLLTFLLCTSMLAGCSKPSKLPSPEDLIAGAFGGEEIQSLNARLRTDIDINVDLTATEIGGLLQMAYVMDADVMEDPSGNVAVKGDVSYTILGVDGSKKLERYELNEGDSKTIYELDDVENTWTKESVSKDDGLFSLVSIANVIDIANFEKKTLTVEESATKYIVKGIMKTSAIEDSFDILNSLIGSENLISNDIIFNVFIEFDKESDLIDSMSFIINTEDAPDNIKETYQKLMINVDIKEINNSVVVLPDYVVTGVATE